MAAIILKSTLDNCLGTFSFHETSPRRHHKLTPCSESSVERTILVYAQFFNEDIRLHSVTWELLSLRKIELLNLEEESAVLGLLSNVPEDELYLEICHIQETILPSFSRRYGVHRELITIMNLFTSFLQFRVIKGISDSILFQHLSPKMQADELNNIQGIFRENFLSNALPTIAMRSLLGNPIISTIPYPRVTKLLVARLVDDSPTRRSPLVLNKSIIIRSVLGRSILIWSQLWKMPTGTVKDRDLIKHSLRLRNKVVLSTRADRYRTHDRLLTEEETGLKMALQTGLIAHISFADRDREDSEDEEEQKIASSSGSGGDRRVIHAHSYLKMYKEWTVAKTAELITLALSSPNGDPNYRNAEGQTALHTCQRLEIAKALETGDKLEYDSQDQLENTPLFYMVKDGNWEMLQFLLEKNVKLDSRNKNNLTVADACYVFSRIAEPAISIGHVRILTFLLGQGAVLTNRLSLKTPIKRKIALTEQRLSDFDAPDQEWQGESVRANTTQMLGDLKALYTAVDNVTKGYRFKYYLASVCGSCSCCGCCCCSKSSKVHPKP